MIHILNGDNTFNVFQQTQLAQKGQSVVWREILSEGPVAGTKLAEFWQTRQKYISETYNETPDGYGQKILSEWTKLESRRHSDEIVLWFEFDFVCQVNIWFLLSWFSQNVKKDEKISLICPGEVSGTAHFQGLGQLPPDQLEPLFEKRQILNQKDLDIGHNLWKAYQASNPEALQAHLKSSWAQFPYFEVAILNHLRRFPSVFNGLNRLEHKLLDLIEQGYNQPAALFEKIWNDEKFLGLTDLQILNHLLELRNASTPAISIIDLASIDHPQVANLSLWRFSLTEKGEEILNGKKDWIHLNGIQRSLGGVHLEGKKASWRWNEDTKHLVSA